MVSFGLLTSISFDMTAWIHVVRRTPMSSVDRYLFKAIHTAHEGTCSYCSNLDCDLSNNSLCATVNSISDRTLFNSLKSLSFNCRGKSPFKWKFQRVHIALEGLENTVGFSHYMVPFFLSLCSLICKATYWEGLVSVVVIR